MAEKKMKSKELKRKNIMDSIQRIDDFLGNFDAERDQNEIAIRLSRLDKLMEAFESIQGEYEAFDDSPEFEAANTKVAMVEVQLDEHTTVPPSMLIAFAICTTLLVAVHMLALMISTCILPNIETVCNLHSISLVNESPHERLHWYIETAWAFSTLLGLILFLFEIAILCWVKFYDLNTTAAWSACIVLIPVLVIFVAFALHFYRSLMTHKYEVTVSGIRELEMLKEQIEQDHLDHHHHHGPPYQSVQIV